MSKINETDICPQNHKNDKECLAAIAEPLLLWYDDHARILPWRTLHTPYGVWVSEIMLQQTRVEAVIPYFMRFMDALPTIEALAQVDEETLLKLWQGLGYYNRVRNLQKGARMVMEQYGGQLPADYDQLLQITGIGEYTAGAIASIAFGRRAAAVDGNVLRVLARVLDCDEDIGQPAVKKAFRTAAEEMLPQKRAGDFNQAVMDLGATVCLPNAVPHCAVCPLAHLCRGRKSGNAVNLPKKSPKKLRKIQPITVFIIGDDSKILLRKRMDTGLLAGLWELPYISGHLAQEEAEAALYQWGFASLRIQKLPPTKHLFTHIEWQMEGYRVWTAEQIPFKNSVWVNEKERKEGFALPSAFSPYMKWI